MIVIAGTIDLEPQHRDGCVAASREMQASTRNDEPGCLAYSFAADPCNDGRICVYELWADTASLAAHFEHPNYHGMRQLLGGYGLRTSNVKKYRVDHSEPVYDDTRTPRADFFSAAD